MSNEVILFLKGAVYISPALALFGAVYHFTNKWYDVQQDKLKLKASEQQQNARVQTGSRKE